eukprot:1827129-Amphidinium_carterae.2
MPQRAMQLQPAQIVCEGRPPQMTKGHQTPQVAIAAMTYEMNAAEKVVLTHDAIDTSLRFSLRVEGEEGAKDAVTRCCIYPLSRKKVHIVHAQEHSLALAKETLKVQANAAVQFGKGVWVPREGDITTIKKFLKDMAPEAHEHLVECWKPKFSVSLTDAGFSVTPSKAFQEATKVAWTKADTLDEAKKSAKEVPKDASVKQGVEGSSTPWTKEASLFIEGSRRKGGQASFGLRLPPSMYGTMQERLGKDARKSYTISAPPHGKGKSNTLLEARDLTAAKEVRQKAKDAQKQGAAPRTETWKTLLKALPLPADSGLGEPIEQASTESPWSAWDTHDNQNHEASASDSFDDEWCEDEENMDCDWTLEEAHDKFEPRKRKVNEQGEAESPQVTDLKKESTQRKKQLAILTSTIGEFKEELVRMRQSLIESKPMRAEEVVLIPAAEAPLDDGNDVIESFEGQQEAVTYPAASAFDRRRREAAEARRVFQLARLHHDSTMKAAREVPWRDVRPEGNLCFWRSIGAILQLKQHANQGKSALILRQEVCEWGILNATEVAKQLECPPNTLLRDIRNVQRRGVMAIKKCYALASLYFDLKQLIVDEDLAICWGLLPLQHGVDNMMMWPLWCKSNHFNYGTEMVDCAAFPAMDALLGSDGEDAAPNKMQMIAGGRNKWSRDWKLQRKSRKLWPLGLPTLGGTKQPCERAKVTGGLIELIATFRPPRNKTIASLLGFANVMEAVFGNVGSELLCFTLLLDPPTSELGTSFVLELSGSNL